MERVEHTLRIPARSWVWVWANNLPGLNAKCINCCSTGAAERERRRGGGEADGKIVEQLQSSFEGIFKVHATILADSGVKRQTSN